MTNNAATAAALVLRCDRTGRIQSVLRWSLSDTVQPETGKHVSTIVDGGSAAKVGYFLQQILDDGAAFDWQINIAGQQQVNTFSFWGVDSGESLLVLAGGSSMFDLQNELTRINNELSNLYRRVTQQNQTLVEQRSRLESILGAIEVSVIEVDPDGIVNFLNSTLRNTIGIPEERQHRVPLAEIVHLTTGGENLVTTLDTVETVRHFEDASLTSIATGRTLPVSGTIAPVTGTHGEIVARVITLHDLTIREQHQQMLLSATLMQASRRITAGMSHNINNLMTIVLGNTYHLENPDDTPLPPATRAAVDSIKDAAKRAAAITDRMMYYSQDRVHPAEHQAEHQDLNAIVREFLADWEVSDNVTLETAITADPAPIRTDRAQIETLLFHLLQNAAEAIKHTGTIRVHTGTDSESVGSATRRIWRLHVCDDGEGMDQETRENMFEPFFSTRFLGRGLGLAAVDGIIRAHNGTVRVVSAPGGGTTLDVSLPLEE